jgi:ABC-type lipoprotein release transport system permease subunit
MRQVIHDYFAQDALRQKLREAAVGAVTFSDADKARMTQNLMSQMKDVELSEEEKQRIGERTQEVASKLAAQVAGQFAEKMASQLESKLSQALGQTLATTMQSYMEQVMTAVMTQLGTRMQEQLTGALSTSMQQAMGSVMERMMQQMADVFSVDEKAFAEAFEFKMDEKELSQLMATLMSTERTSYDKNLVKLGYTSIEKPSEIDIYPVNFDSKAEVTKVLDDYNDRMREEDEGKVITYTDVVGALMSSVTDIVNMISYVLIAFVAISLIVSSIMIGVITYISVLERKKEIGILRSIGASKRDVSRVFNAETVIEGFVSGVMGVTITAVACIPANIIVERIHDIHDIARLPVGAAIVLIGISVFLSFIAGLIPSSKAAKADPVEALRSE